MNPAIQSGSKVEIEYTLSYDAGTVLDSNKGEAPLTYTQGQEQIIPGLENALNGMRAGEEKQVTLAPEDGYGPSDPRAQAEVAKEAIPPGALNVGTELTARGPSGEALPVRVKEINETTVVLDLNHPLAGKTRHFDVTVLQVDPPTR